jgi:hypothetical protein
MKKYIFKMYYPILEEKDQKKFNSLKNERIEQIKFYRKLQKKEIRKLLDKTIKGHWHKPTDREDYKNLGSLAEWLVLDYFSRNSEDDIKNCIYNNDRYREEIAELEKKIKELEEKAQK